MAGNAGNLVKRYFPFTISARKLLREDWWNDLPVYATTDVTSRPGFCFPSSPSSNLEALDTFSDPLIFLNTTSRCSPFVNSDSRMFVCSRFVRSKLLESSTAN